MRHTARRRAKLWTGVIAIILLGLATAAEGDCETTPQDDPADTVIAAPEPTQPSPTASPTALVRSPTPTDIAQLRFRTPIPPSVEGHRGTPHTQHGEPAGGHGRCGRSGWR